MDLRVVQMKPAHVLWWHSQVQPVIDADESRVDRHWNWLLYSAFGFLTGYVLNRQPAGYVVGVPRGDVFIPCGLAMLLGRIYALDEQRKRATGVWFLSTAPRSALTSLPGHSLTEDEVPRRLGRLTLDVAVTHSLNTWGRGRTALYADEKGGDALLDWYKAQGMVVLPATKRLPKGPRRLLKPSDGRYCYYTAESGQRASAELEDYR